MSTKRDMVGLIVSGWVEDSDHFPKIGKRMGKACGEVNVNMEMTFHSKSRSVRSRSQMQQLFN